MMQLAVPIGRFTDGLLMLTSLAVLADLWHSFQCAQSLMPHPSALRRSTLPLFGGLNSARFAPHT